MTIAGVCCGLQPVGSNARAAAPSEAPACGAPSRSARSCSFVLVAMVLLAASVAFGEDGLPDDDAALFGLSIEELVEMQVTSVAGVERDWFATPSAITVITNEQLRRSGHTHLAEALRMVPGMHVARVDSRQWAVTARGFSNLFSNGLQVVIDGRVVYNQLFGGVYWDVQDLLLEDVERIEVIRGPGATLWGANAVNGVVNVITKRASDTQGSYVSGGAGNEERGFAEARHGGRVGEDLAYRVWGRYSNRDATQRGRSNPTLGVSRHTQRGDDWQLGLAGFQLEKPLRHGLELTLQGQAHSTDRLGQSLPSPTGLIEGDTKSDGGHLLARLTRSTAPERSWTLQVYYDVESRRGANGFDDRRDTVDGSFRQEIGLGGTHDLLWGAGYRYRRQDTEPSSLLVLDPESRNTHLVTAFVQDTITLVPDRLFLMLGSKFGHNDFTGFEVQPGGRAWWTPNPRTTLWLAISRPVRTPTLVEEDIIAITGATTTLRGERSLNAETLVAYELGGRRQITPSWLIDVAAFFNQYDDLVRRSPATGGNEVFANVGGARSYGVEISTLWQVMDRLRIDASYTFFELDAGSAAVRLDAQSTPGHQAQIRTRIDLTRRIGADFAAYYVGRVRRFDIESYVRLDVGLHWMPRDWIELAVFGQNLLGPHAEFFQAARIDTQPEIERSFYGRVKLRFP